MTDIIFYKYTGENNHLYKNLSDGKTISCNFNLEYDLINPKIRIVTSNSFDYNYCYIPSLKRYYFIDENMIKRNNFYEMQLTLDVLMTYQNEILNLYGTVTRSQENNYLLSNSPEQTAKPTIDKYEFDASNFNTNGFYILVSTGVNN